MNRCHSSFTFKHFSRRTATCAALILFAVCATTVQAQVVVPIARAFPAQAQRATLVVVTPPDILINTRPDRLSPGARIRDTSNRLILSASMVGQTYLVNYLRDAAGMVHEVWILTAQEAALPQPAAQ